MLFISTFRGKLGVIGLASCIILMAKGLKLGLTVGEIMSEMGFPILILLLLGISFLLPEIVYLKDGPVTTWGRWGSARDALTQEDYEGIKFLCFYPKTKYAIGADESGRRVATTLIRCNCGDFKKNKRPCAHMHKLAELLEVHDVEPEK